MTQRPQPCPKGLKPATPPPPPPKKVEIDTFEVYRRRDAEEQQQKAARLVNCEIENEKLKQENSTLRKSIDYWSHCMWEGMLKTCPKKKEELRKFLASCGVEPYASLDGVTAGQK